MPEYAPLEIPENPKLAHNITHFARALRRAGLPVGTGRVIDAIRAVEAAGFTDAHGFLLDAACLLRHRGPSTGRSSTRSSGSTGAIRAISST